MRLRRMGWVLWCVVLAVAWMPGVAPAATTNFYYVNVSNTAPNSPFMTWTDAATNIQDAVDEAENDLDIPGGTYCEVVVTGGLYVAKEAIMLSKAIRLRSLTGDPATTILAGGSPASSNRVMTIVGEAWVSGFTISNGYAYGEAPDNYGGGVYMTTNLAGLGGSVSNCRIVGNQARRAPSAAVGKGSGIYIDGHGTVSNCLIQSNSSDLSAGTGVYLSHGGLVADCVILDNNGSSGVGSSGGGVYFDYGGELRDSLVGRNTARHNAGLCFDHAGQASGCTISNNYGGNAKGVLISYGGELRDSVVEHNTSGYTTGTAGGISLSRGGLVDRCIVRYNSAGAVGGIQNDRGTVRSTLVYGNETVGSVGGVQNSAFAASILENLTVVRNAAASGGGIVINTSSGVPYGGDVRNVISYYNTATDGSNDVVFVPYTGYDIADNNRFVYSCVTPAIPGEGNTASEPVFRSSGSGAGLSAVPGVYTLRGASPCRDTGTNLAWMTTAVDLAGNSRIMPELGRVDMGAYEGFPIVTAPGVLLQLD